MPVRRSHPQLARSLKPGPSTGPADRYPATSLHLWLTAVDRQLCSPCRLRLRIPAIVRRVAACTLPTTPGQDHQRDCVYVPVCQSVCAANCPLLCQSTLQVPKLSVLQLYSVCAAVLSQHGSEHFPFAHLLMLTFFNPFKLTVVKWLTLQRYWSNFSTFRHSGAECPNVKKLKRMTYTSMALNTLVD